MSEFQDGVIGKGKRAVKKHPWIAVFIVVFVVALLLAYGTN